MVFAVADIGLENEIPSVAEDRLSRTISVLLRLQSASRREVISIYKLPTGT